MKMSMSRQRGMALVVGLILLAAATIITVAGMQGMQMQERMTSNQNNKAISSMAAEAGVSALWAQLQSRSGIPQDLTSLNLPDAATDAVILRQDSRAAYWFDSSQWQVVDATTLVAMAVGQALDAGQDRTNPLSETHLLARFSLAPGTGGRSLFEDGVVGCEGVNMGGSGQVDSFNSEFGSYGDLVTDGEGNQFQNSLRTNVTVRTIRDYATFDFSGGAEIYGNLSHTGSHLNLRNQANIRGDVQAQGTVSADGEVFGTLTAGGDINFGRAAIQHGAALSGGDVTSEGRINDTLTAAGDITFTNASEQYGAVVSGGNVDVGETADYPTSISAAGEITYPGWWQWDSNLMDVVAAGYQGNQTVGIPNIPSLLTDEACDEAGVRTPNGDLGEMFANALSNPDAVRITDYVGPGGHSENQNRVSLTGPGGQNSSRTLGQDNTDTVLYVDHNLTTSGNLNDIIVRGNVTLVVDGDFELSGNTQMIIEENATIQILVTGESKFSGGSNLVGDGPFLRGDDMAPAVILYSAYESSGPNDVGVFVGGANNSSVSVYAPYATARLVGSGEIFGAARAQYVDIRGNGDIHYDEMLRGLGESGGGGETAVWRITSWHETLD